jgi:hypothetical protein
MGINKVFVPSISSNSTISIYPNPTTGTLYIRSEESEVRNVEIFDVYGRNLSHLTFHTSPVEINISHLANGLYFLKIDGKMYKVIKNSCYAI